jgi:hypothetical protein
MRLLLMCLLPFVFTSCGIFGKTFNTVIIQITNTVSKDEYHIRCNFSVINGVDHEAKEEMLEYGTYENQLDNENISIIDGITDENISETFFFNPSTNFTDGYIDLWIFKKLDKIQHKKVDFGDQNDLCIAVYEAMFADILPIYITNSPVDIVYEW